MYKCTICNKEFKEKPDFCDCGNDEFTFDGKIEQKKTPVIIEKEEPNITLNTEKSPKKKVDKGEVVSVIFFLFCILFSVLFICFFGKGGVREETSAPEKKEVATTPIQMPDINELWIENQIQKEEPKKTAKQANSIKSQPIKKQAAKKPIQTAIPVKVQQKQAQTAQKPVQNVIAKKTPAQPPAQTQAISAQGATQQPQTQAPVNTEQQKQELKNYKIQLRNAIAAKINFAAVAGDGRCAATFKISNNGQLINRTFTQLSQNDTLNDSVYQGLSKLNYFNPPPVYYKNETLKLTVTMQDGNFTVTLN